MPEVELERDGTVATLRLNRPERRNATTPELWRLLGALAAEVENDPAVRAVILTGAGEAVCSGADVGAGFPKTRAEARSRMALAQQATARLYNLQKPVVAAVRGPAVGSGVALALCADFTLASETARFAYAYTRIGVLGDAGALYFLAQRVGMVRAKDLAYTGRFVDSAEALALGLCERRVADTELAGEAASLAARLAEGPPLAIGATKRLLQQAWPNLEAFLAQESLAVPLLAGSGDAAEGIAALREKRPPRFRGE
jgi:2-(1,2-epoxy-1,2-dihydrophenyl)acetyl-CoA isomerase